MTPIVKKLANKLISSAQKAVDEILFSPEELQHELLQYAEIISSQFVYFNELTSLEKERFLQRVYYFRKLKDFHYTGLEPDQKIEVLISACAVQITYGLRSYKMPFFKDIYVLADQYMFGLNNQNWIGHVNRKGIYLSWKHFLEGYSNNHDRNNVGLHEMAHALEYVNFLGFFSRDEHFVENFMLYKTRSELIFPKENNTFHYLFTEQGRQNYHESWAEGVELFFENSKELYEYYPDLYLLIKKLLNQDPVNGIKILKAV